MFQSNNVAFLELQLFSDQKQALNRSCDPGTKLKGIGHATNYKLVMPDTFLAINKERQQVYLEAVEVEVVKEFAQGKAAAIHIS